MEAVVFGAGNVGRGFLGESFSAAGLGVTFVDVDPGLVAALNEAGSYQCTTVSNDGRRREEVGPVRALLAADVDAVGEAVVGASLAATAVGVGALPSLAPVLARAVKTRAAVGAGPLNLILAENLADAPARVREMLQQADPSLTDEFLMENLALVSASIGRMIPAPRPELTATEPAAIEVEPYRHLLLDAAAVKGELPEVENFVLDETVPFEYYVDRKLTIHNMGHSLCAYLGMLRGDRYIWQAVGQVEVRYCVRAAMVESAAAVAARYGMPMGPLLEHIDDLLYRFANRALGDTSARVGGDPLRKLSSNDRFQRALQACLDEGVPYRFVALGAGAGLRHLKADQGWGDEAVKRWFAGQAKGLSEEQVQLVWEFYEALAEGFDFAAVQGLLEESFHGATIP